MRRVRHLRRGLPRPHTRPASRPARGPALTDALPELRQTVLDEPALERLFEEIATLTSVIEVRTKGGPTASSAASDLRSALEALRAGATRGVQVVYAWSGQRWVDTVIRGPEGFRVTRIQVQQP